MTPSSCTVALKGCLVGAPTFRNAEGMLGISYCEFAVEPEDLFDEAIGGVIHCCTHAPVENELRTYGRDGVEVHCVGHLLITSDARGELRVEMFPWSVQISTGSEEVDSEGIQDEELN